VCIAVETKAADRINTAQLERYADAGFAPVLYVPGLSGLLYEPNEPLADEHWVTGADVAHAELSGIIASYVDPVADAALRVADAPAFAREPDDFTHAGRTGYDDLMDAAWIVETVAAMAPPPPQRRSSCAPNATTVACTGRVPAPALPAATARA
jgi:hypothetical protein